MNKVKTFLAIGLYGFSAASMAASVHVKFDSNIFSGSGYDAVSIGYPSGSAAVAAGRFQGTASAVAGAQAKAVSPTPPSGAPMA